VDKYSRGGHEYFDGKYYYQSRSYNEFASIGNDGTKNEWTNGGHGNCEKFFVWNNFVYLDIDAMYEDDQYRATDAYSNPIRKGCFK
jgi:hypothetical protein